ncbi:ABC transporter ATP-binding protein [Dehalococcoidia bacterium]|nr:ABC transporter ATP-binding protein [Dehalococcoidia bacterium]MCL0049426.1 ABC transporter ATP-binding protein [Dehalococcoidia bacterium]MCL0059647.1 ABC transporter ATP-binding protein [Dehalococcoidia bacterium]MCL0069345.1 ABC transporter ATP-binding protein [Dehalococcoidia bacterium]MCL0073053.1 ABC transporter ATP-binding protein [Dehalococcoidia bacterium]
MQKAYRVEQLTKVYAKGPMANDKIDLEIAQGEIFGVFGPNGAGKTTLVRQMAGLLRPTSGSIFLFGHDVVAKPAVVPHYVGYYNQIVVGLNSHKFREALYITGRLRGQSKAEAQKQADGLIERFDVKELADRLVGKLSGGERRLAALLSTFMNYSRLLILDEPTNELDPVRRRLVWDYLHELNGQRGTTIILVTHNVLEAEWVVQRVTIIDLGKLQAMGTPGQLKRLVEDTVRLEVRLRSGQEEQAQDFLAAIPDSIRLRPAVWQITSSKGEASALFSTVIERLGFETLDDFRLITPTFEDVYIKLTGKRWEGNDERGNGAS